MPDRYLFLSPHYDDAVYSCGGFMHTLAQSGAEVLNITLMAGMPAPPFPQTPVLADNLSRWQAGDNPMQTRRIEDQNAAAIIGADTLYMPILDCLYRVDGNQQALYPTEESLWQAPHPADPAAAQIAAFPLNLAGFRAVIAPLAAGQHVDHQLVRNQALRWQAEGVTVWLYEDYPYMRQPETIQQARLNAGVDGHLKPVDQVFDEATMRVKVKAMRAYTSQISSFWANKNAIAEEVRDTFRDDVSGFYRERFWRVVL